MSFFAGFQACKPPPDPFHGPPGSKTRLRKTEKIRVSGRRCGIGGTFFRKFHIFLTSQPPRRVLFKIFKKASSPGRFRCFHPPSSVRRTSSEKTKIARILKKRPPFLHFCKINFNFIKVKCNKLKHRTNLLILLRLAIVNTCPKTPESAFWSPQSYIFAFFDIWQYHFKSFSLPR